MTAQRDAALFRRVQRGTCLRVLDRYTQPPDMFALRATKLPAQLITPRKPPFTRQMTKQPFSSISQFAGDSAAYSKRLLELTNSLTQNQPDDNVSLLQLDRMRQLVVCIHEHPNVAAVRLEDGFSPVVAGGKETQQARGTCSTG